MYLMASSNKRIEIDFEKIKGSFTIFPTTIFLRFLAISDQLSYLQSCDNFRVTFSCHLSELIHRQDVTKCQFISNM